MGMGVYASLLGHLLMRTLDRAQRIHSAMWCRGFDGKIRIMSPLSFGRTEFLFVVLWTTLFMVMRFVNIPQLMGARIAGFLS